MKNLLLLTLLWMLSMAIQAQDKTKNIPIAQFGLKGGLNLASVKTDLYKNVEARKGYHAGILSHIHFNQHLALQPEAVYSQQGFKQNISSGLTLTMKLDYLNIPVLVQYMYRGFRLETGPQIGFLLRAKADYTDGRKEGMKSYLQSTDFSWVFGVSYLTTLGVGLHARYNLGISNINEELKVAGVSNSEINNQVWQFGIFYQIPMH